MSESETSTFRDDEDSDGLHDADDNGGTNLILGANGFIVEAAESNVAVMYNPRKKRVDIRNVPRIVNGTFQEPTPQEGSPQASLWVQGNIVAKKIDLLNAIHKLESQVQQLQTENTQMKKMLEEMYYAPGMPGFIQVEEEFYSMVNEVTNIVTSQ